MWFCQGRCESLGWKEKTLAAHEAPVAKTPLQERTAASYHYKEGDWCQLRLELTAARPNRPRDRDEARRLFVYRAKVSVWQFNEDRGDYNRLVATGSPSGGEGVSFAYYRSRGDDVLMMSGAGGGPGGGGCGMPGGGFTLVSMRADPKHASNGFTKTENELDYPVTVTATVTMATTKEEREFGLSETKAEVKRTWTARRLPGREAEFLEVGG